jgi:hypothetical protein
MVKKNELVEHLVTYQLNMIGKDFSETEKDKEWYCNNRITEQQHKEFAAYAKTQIQKVFKCGKKRAEKEFMWFDLMCGLSIEE